MLKDIIKLPTNRIKLPKSQELINIRSFTSGERKALQLSLQGDDNIMVSSTLQNTLEACIIEDIKLNTLPLIDIEYIFLELHKISEGDLIEIGYICEGDFNKDGKVEVCNHRADITFDLNDVEYELLEVDNQKTFKITNEVTLTFERIDANSFFDVFGELVSKKDITSLESEKRRYLDALVGVTDGNKQINLNDYSDEEIWGLLEYIPGHLVHDIESFISDRDHIILKKEFKCQKCGKNHKVKHSGIEDFLV